MPLIRLKDIQLRFRSWKSAASRTQVLSLFTAAAAVIVCLVVVFASLVLALNPYQPLYDYIRQVILSQPDLEMRMSYGTLAQQYLSNSMDVEDALVVAGWYDGLTETQLSGIAAQFGDDTGNVAETIRLTSNFAHQIKSMQNSLAVIKNNPVLADNIAALRNDPAAMQPDRLIAVWDGTRDMVQWINALRSQIRDLQNSAQPLMANEEVRAVMIRIAAQPEAAGADMEAPLQALARAYSEWQGLEVHCQSLEIQFANTVSVLTNLNQTIDSAYRSDTSWGYSFWAPGAQMITAYRLPLLIAAAVVLLLSLIGLQGRKLTFPQPKKANFSRKMRTFSTRFIENPAPPLHGQSFLQESRIFVKRLIEPPQGRTGARKGGLRFAQLVVVQANGQREELSLSPNTTCRIGNDPSFQVFIPQSGAAYVEIWIRKAHAGYYLEVMFSDKPVLLNARTVTSARALRHGDLIEVDETSIIYLEK